MNSRKNGFNMIELMAVLAVIAILSALAIPNFQGKIVRDQIAQALPLADMAKAPIAMSWALGQTFPLDNVASGLPAADKIVSNLVSAVTVHEGAIDITFGNSVNAHLKGKVLTLRPAVVEEAPTVPITWVCGSALAPNNMTIKGGSNNTSVPAEFLPLKCMAR